MNQPSIPEIINMQVLPAKELENAIHAAVAKLHTEIHNLELRQQRTSKQVDSLLKTNDNLVQQRDKANTELEQAKRNLEMMAGAIGEARGRLMELYRLALSIAGGSLIEVWTSPEETKKMAGQISDLRRASQEQEERITQLGNTQLELQKENYRLAKEAAIDKGEIAAFTEQGKIFESLAIQAGWDQKGSLVDFIGQSIQAFKVQEAKQDGVTEAFIGMAVELAEKRTEVKALTDERDVARQALDQTITIKDKHWGRLVAIKELITEDAPLIFSIPRRGTYSVSFADRLEPRAVASGFIFLIDKLVSDSNLDKEIPF